jgi:hypothetical protein
MLSEIKKRSDCIYKVTQEREAAPAGEPTKQVLELSYSLTEQAWVLEHRTFSPLKSWLD